MCCCIAFWLSLFIGYDAWRSAVVVVVGVAVDSICRDVVGDEKIVTAVWRYGFQTSQRSARLVQVVERISDAARYHVCNGVRPHGHRQNTEQTVHIAHSRLPRSNQDSPSQRWSLTLIGILSHTHTPQIDVAEEVYVLTSRRFVTCVLCPP